MNKSFDPNISQEKIKNLQNAGGKTAFDTSTPVDYMVKIRPDKTVSPAKFKPDPLIPGGYMAHPTTIAAMRKNIFYTDSFDDLERPYTCERCKTPLDLQFWHFCPYCEAPFPKDILR